ncbi:MAG: sirohydrochlorin chelatase [Halanaerobium sp.]
MADKKALVVVSHGSKRKESNQEFKDFIKKLNKVNSEGIESEYTKIKGACLEFASPQLEIVIKNLIISGYEKIDIFPLFIFAGYHVREDIPQRMEELKNKYNQLEYKILEHPAAADDFADYIFTQALNQK